MSVYKPSPQEIAAGALENVRARKGEEDSDLDVLVAHAFGQINALEAVGALTPREALLWYRRIGELREADDEPPDPATSTGRSRHEVGLAPSPRFVRLVAGPAEERPLLDGRIRIVALELFLDRVRVHWNMAPLPSFDSIMGDDLAALDQDTEGLEPERRSLLRDSAFKQRLSRLTLFGAAVTDDVGTA